MRVRARFAKLGKLRWTSHRDVARMWERAVRRVGLPLAYTEGFSPRPRISFGLALPTGHESVAEYLDLELTQLDDPGGLVARLDGALPDGIDVAAATRLEAGTGSLQEEVTSCSWEIEVTGMDRQAAAALVEAAMGADTLEVTRERKGRPSTDDIRPALRSLCVSDTASWLPGPPSGGLASTGRTSCHTGAVLLAELATQPRGVRPSELVRALDPALELGRARRTHQWIERDGARREPLPPGPPDAPHAYERAS